MASEATMAAYRGTVFVLMNHVSANEKIYPETVIREAANTSSPSVWYRHRAALLAVATERIAKAAKTYGLEDLDLESLTDPRTIPALQRLDPQTLTTSLTFWLDLKRMMPHGCPVPSDKRQRRISKRKHLQGLPTNWRERVIARMRKDRLPALVAAVSGCRPQELVKGVRVRKTEAGLEIEIQGAKVTAYSGQPLRTLYWHNVSASPLLAALAAESGIGVGWTTVSIASTKRFSTAVRDAGKREWPKQKNTVTPYCFRHQVSADMKASGMSNEEISGALGHAVDDTKRYYGTARQGSSVVTVAPTKVTFTRAIKNTSTDPTMKFAPRAARVRPGLTAH